MGWSAASGILVLAGVIASGLIHPAVAGAQGSDDCVEARRHFERAAAAAEEFRFSDDVVEGFRRAYMLCGVPTALFNAGLALRALGRHCEARDSFGGVVASHPDWGNAEEARRLRSEAAGRCSIVRLTNLEPVDEYVVRVDGRQRETEPREIRELEVDPGTHTVLTEREGYEPFVWEGSLEDGSEVEVEVLLREIETGMSTGGKVALVCAAVAVLLGAGMVTYFTVAEDPDLQPNSENVIRVEFGQP